MAGTISPNKPKEKRMQGYIKKLFDKWHLEASLYHNLAEARKKFGRECSNIGAKFKKEIAVVERQLKKKLKQAEQLKIWKGKGYERLLNDVRKKSDASMKKARKNYKLALARIKSLR